MHDAAHPIRARGQRHRDAPLSRRGRALWLATYAIIVGALVALVVYALFQGAD